MRIGIITPNNLWFCPYVQIYRSVLDKENIDYNIITWCRDGIDEDGCIQYKNSKLRFVSLFKFLSYFLFARFVKKEIRKKSFDKLIVFTPQIGIFISSFLKKYYKGKYIFDYRDLSIEQLPFFKMSFLRLLDNSEANVISSPGFKQYLPQGYNYILSHNFDINTVRDALDKRDDISQLSSKVIDVLTIGGIRDYDSNVQVMDALSNQSGITMRFVGRGPSAEQLEVHAKEKEINNVRFIGFYPKEKEKEYIAESTFLNIFYPRRPSHDTALSNRFYNSLIYRKPMITTADTTQGYYAEVYNVGLAIKDCNHLAEDLHLYLKNIDRETYYRQCDILLNEFITDYDRFLGVLQQFIDK